MRGTRKIIHHRLIPHYPSPVSDTPRTSTHSTVRAIEHMIRGLLNRDASLVDSHAAHSLSGAGGGPRPRVR